MTDKGKITLPRKHIDHAAHALEHFNKDAPDPLVSETIHHLRTHLAAEQPKPHPLIPLHQSDCALLIGGYQCTCGFRQRQNKTPTALAAEQPKTPAWWRDGLAATLMREGVNKHRAREIAVGYWEAYCQIPGNKEDET